ncbi:MAG: hypothetical protein A2Y24_06260 [Clostridiales bacterium GWE2_32_10]|nr:MAG: hypothetical protein A2Y24_06260 [Clostridiales bacterium GWE2_32_10]HBY21489.1 conjugal transfer protein TraX [Clostridiales bacterium]
MTITKEQSNYIKLIAILTMLVDHMGVILFPEVLWLRIIGRIAFPLFAYQLVVGYLNTGNIRRYIFRLLLLGSICQVMYYYITKDLTLNILFTLSVGLVCINLIDKKKYIVLSLLLVITSVMSFYNMGVDYGVYGVLIIILIYTYINNTNLLIASFIILTTVAVSTDMIQSDYQIYSIVAMIFLVKPMSLRFKIPGWFFYLFYPIHIAVLWGIKGIWFR